MSTINCPLTAQDIMTDSQYPKFMLGQQGETCDGRKYRYCKAGGTALVVGDVQQNAAEDTNFNALVVPTTYAIGVNRITVTLGGTAVTASLFAEGYVIITLGTGLGYQYKIRAHDVQTSTTGTLTIDLEDALVVALDTTSRVCLKRNPYHGVIVAPYNTPTGAMVGVAVYPITASYYGWVQTGGICPVLCDATTFAVGDMVGMSDATDGAAMTATLALGKLGVAMSTGTSTYFNPVFLSV